jgi:hypothetical protein
MAGPSLIDRVVLALSGRADAGDQREQQLLADMVEMIVDTVEPRAAAYWLSGEASGLCARRLPSAPRRQDALGPVLLTRTNWNEDPRERILRQSRRCLDSWRNNELRAFFDDPANTEVAEAFALLG